MTREALNRLDKKIKRTNSIIEFYETLEGRNIPFFGWRTAQSSRDKLHRLEEKRLDLLTKLRITMREEIDDVESNDWNSL